MTQAGTPIEQALLAKVRSLPLNRQQEVLDFAEFLTLKTKENQAEKPQAATLPSAISSSIDVRQLSGMLYRAEQQTISLEEMDQAIAECAEESA